MKKTPAAEIVARFSTPGKFISTMSFGSWVTKVPKKKPWDGKRKPGASFGRRCGVFYNFHTGASVGLVVVEPCDTLWLGSPGQPIPLDGASSKAAKILSCLSIPVSAVSMRLIAYVWRKRQPALKQERYGPTSLERG